MKKKKTTKKAKGRQTQPLPAWKKAVFDILDRLSAWFNRLKRG